MSFERINTFRALLDEARNSDQQRMAVAAAGEDTVIGAVAHAVREGLVHPILIGDAACIHTLAVQHQLDMDAVEVIDVPDPVEASLTAVKLVHDGEAELVDRKSTRLNSSHYS